MPVEIRELVIQARLQESGTSGMSDAQRPTSVVQRNKTGAEDAEEVLESPAPYPEWMEQLVERCLQRMEARLAEKFIR